MDECVKAMMWSVRAELRFTCWMGAYPGLTEHFAKANLDPKANQWDKVPCSFSPQTHSHTAFMTRSSPTSTRCDIGPPAPP